MDYQFSNIQTQDFEVFTVNGRPAGEVHWLRQQGSSGGNQYSGLWRSGPITFDYIFPGDEIFYALKGELEIAIGNSETITVKEGDVVAFDKGVESVWTVKRWFAKFFVIV